jgi:hypothetical protein
MVLIIKVRGVPMKIKILASAQVDAVFVASSILGPMLIRDLGNNVLEIRDGGDREIQDLQEAGVFVQRIPDSAPD